MKYSRFYKKFFIFLAIIVILYFLFQNKIDKFFTDDLGLAKPKEVVLQTIDDLLAETRKNIIAPPPLKSDEDSLQSILIKSEVIKWTNVQRQKNSLSVLKENLKLDLSADIKVKDMFINQYFEHKSLSGIGVDGLVKETGYEYIIIGENLAMGNFENSERLVEAWMASPGHRENILNSKYQDIGVAVLKGVYQGRQVWMAVQHFGMPISACLKPNEDLKAEIDADEQAVSQLKINLDALRIELETQKPKSRQEVEIYNDKVNTYNYNLNQYNLFVEQIKNLINNYNTQVEIFNNCLIEAKN